MTLELPLPKMGKQILSLNVYRNAHFRALAKAKNDYEQLIRIKLRPHRRTRFDSPTVIYTLFNKTKRRRDLSNFCTIIDKFFMDALVSMKMIGDDDCTVIKDVRYKFGGYGEDKVIVEVKQ